MCSRRGTMVACRRECDGRGDQGQREEMAEMHRKIEELSQVVQALLQRGRARANQEVPKGDSEPFDIPEGSQEDECDEECKENLFHDACYANMDSVAVEDSSVDWETPPIYDEYEEDDGELVLEDLEEISTSEIHLFRNEENGESTLKLFEDRKDARIHSFEKSGLCTCENVESIFVHLIKPLTFYADLYPVKSQRSMPIKDTCYISSTNIFRKRESFQYEVPKERKILIEVKGASRKLVNSNIQRWQNSEAERIIRHGKIRGRIFSNRRSMMQGDSIESANL